MPIRAPLPPPQVPAGPSACAHYQLPFPAPSRRRPRAAVGEVAIAIINIVAYE